MSLMQPEKLTGDGTRHIQEAGPERDHRRGRAELLRHGFFS
jgi:hypothetical protein